MKIRLQIALVLFYLSNLLSSCECIQTICYDAAPFTIVDKVTGQDLVFGNNPTYFKDSLFTRTTRDTFFRSVNALDSSRLLLPNNDTIYLRVNSVDVDTVIIKYDVANKTYCCKQGFSTPTSITYNGRATIKKENRFLFPK